LVGEGEGSVPGCAAIFSQSSIVLAPTPLYVLTIVVWRCFGVAERDDFDLSKVAGDDVTVTSADTESEF
jgi:hypothetical protein